MKEDWHFIFSFLFIFCYRTYYLGGSWNTCSFLFCFFSHLVFLEHAIRFGDSVCGLIYSVPARYMLLKR